MACRDTIPTRLVSPECGLDVAVAAGEADPDRVESFRRLLSAREGATDW